MTSPMRTDVAAREARELAELASTTRNTAMALEACDMLAELFASGYRVSALADPDGVRVRPVRISARFPGTCACGAPIAIGDSVWWRRDAAGVFCERCGARS